MLAYIVSSLIQKTIVLYKTNTSFVLLDCHIQVLFLNHEYYLRLPHNLKYVYKSAVKHGNFVCIRNIKNEQEAYIYFSQYEENFDVFQKYKINKNAIIIGSQIDNDIYPVEVKAGKSTQAKSLSVYSNLYNPKYAIRISTKDFGYNPETKIKSVPLYAVFLI